MKYFLVLLCLGAAANCFLRGSRQYNGVDQNVAPPAAEAVRTSTVEESQVRMTYKKLLTPAYTALIESTEKVEYLRADWRISWKREADGCERYGTATTAMSTPAIGCRR